MKVRGQEVLDPAERIMSFVWVNEATGCWEWQGSLNGTEKLKRYGSLRVVSRGIVRAHRYAWEIFRGPVPRGAWVLHHCDNPPCVNPEHLFLGDWLINSADRDAKGRGKGRAAINRAKTHCPRGHELSGDNLDPSSKREGRRRCRTCLRARQTAGYERKRAILQAPEVKK